MRRHGGKKILGMVKSIGKKCAFYACEKMRTRYVGKKSILCMGKNNVGMHSLKNAHFMRWKKCL